MRRRLYKPERALARKKGVLSKRAPISVLDATPSEITVAIATLCKLSGLAPGRGDGYDPLTDKYHMVVKSLTTGKAQDVTIRGDAVGALVLEFRRLLGRRGVLRSDLAALEARPSGLLIPA